MTSYEVAYGQQSPSMDSYLLGTSKVNVVDSLLQNLEATLTTLKENLVMAQNPINQQANQHQPEHLFEEGDHVFLHLQPYKKTSLKSKGHQKFAPKFYGPYHIIQHIGEVAYKLALLA